MDGYYAMWVRFVRHAKVCPNCGVVKLLANDSEVCFHCPGAKLVLLKEYLEGL